MSLLSLTLYADFIDCLWLNQPLVGKELRRPAIRGTKFYHGACQVTAAAPLTNRMA